MLGRKLRRDLWALRGQVAAIAVVVACGVAVVITTRTSYTSLLGSRAHYYTQYHFADVFAHLKRAPEPVAAAIRQLPGVETAETRIVVEVILDVPGLAEPASARLISLPSGPLRLNQLHLRKGTLPNPGHPGQVVLSEAFARANRLEPGGEIGALVNGRWQALRIAGIAISPEYVYEIGAGNLFPDNRRFGVLWMNRDAIAPAYGMVGAFNDVTLTLARGASETALIARIDRLLDRFGGLGAYGRGEQVSARFLSDEIAQNRVSGTIVPAIFLGAAAFLLHLVLARFVGTERQQIAVLKAFGFDDWTIASHYLKLAVVALFLGAVAGVALGFWFASRVNLQYAQFYRFPTFLFRADMTAVGIALLITAAAAVTGAMSAVRRVVRLAPAEAMRPEVPAQARSRWLSRIGLVRLLGIPFRIIMRTIEQRPLKTSLSIIGIGFATAIMVVGFFFVDAMQYMAAVQFRQVQREDLAIGFTQPASGRARSALAAVPGIRLVEGFRSVPVRITASHRSRRIQLLGMAAGSQLRQVLGRDRERIRIPAGGVVLTAKLGAILAVRAGDTVVISVLEGERQVRSVTVAGLVDEIFGLNGYMEAAALGRLLGEENTLTGAWLRTDPAEADAVLARLKRTPLVATVTSRAAALSGFEETLDRSIGLITSVLIGFAGALAIAMVYNAGRIALAERSRELASLRVLGFTRGEVSLMLLGEQALLTAIGIVVGLLLGYAFAALLSGLYQWELFRIPLVISTRTLLLATLVTAAASALTAGLIRRRLDRMDLVAVLKTRE